MIAVHIQGHDIYETLSMPEVPRKGDVLVRPRIGSVWRCRVVYPALAGFEADVREATLRYDGVQSLGDRRRGPLWVLDPSEQPGIWPGPATVIPLSQVAGHRRRTPRD